MKNIFITLTLILSFAVLTAQTVEIKKLPSSVDEFIELRNEIAVKPEGGATMMMIALMTYVQNPELGEQFLVIAVDRGSLQEGNTYKGFSLRKSDMQLIQGQTGKNKKLLNSYIQGSSPENGYSIKLPYVFKYTDNAYSGDKENGPYKLFLACSGADSPRPITIKKNNKGLWKANNWNSVLVGIKKEPIDDDL